MKKFKQIYIEITTSCNLTCDFCPLTKEMKGKSLSISDFKLRIDKIKDYTNSIYLHVLGEPLLHKNLKEFIEYAYINNVSVNITTNGRFLDLNTLDILLPNVKIINLSLQSLLSENDEDIKKYLVQWLSFIDLKNKLNPALAVHIRIWNDKDKDKVKALNKKFGWFLDEIKARSYKNINIDYDDEFLWPELNHDINALRTSCLGGKSQLAILYNGEVSLCCLDYHGYTSLGNINTTTMDDILNSEKYLKAIKGWNDRNPYFEICRKCTYRNRFRKE